MFLSFREDSHFHNNIKYNAGSVWTHRLNTRVPRQQPGLRDVPCFSASLTSHSIWSHLTDFMAESSKLVMWEIKLASSLSAHCFLECSTISSDKWFIIWVWALTPIKQEGIFRRSETRLPHTVLHADASQKLKWKALVSLFFVFAEQTDSPRLH